VVNTDKAKAQEKKQAGIKENNSKNDESVSKLLGSSNLQDDNNDEHLRQKDSDFWRSNDTLQ